MGSSRQQTWAKAARERTVRERRQRKLEKKRAAAAERKARSTLSAEHDPTRARTGTWDVKLAVGDLVVYGNHGIGRVAARRKQEALGKTQEVVVLELEELRVTLPLALAETQLRPPLNEAELRRVGEALGDNRELSSRNWLSRRRETLEKLVRGTPVELAQIVSEGAQRERLTMENGTKRQLSLSERQVLTKARGLLSDEIALVLDIRPTAAEDWIDRHLARPADVLTPPSTQAG